MFVLKSCQFKCLCKSLNVGLGLATTSAIHKRFVTRKHPIDRDLEYDLPVFQYPVDSSSDRRVYVWGLSEHGALGNKLHIKKYTKRLPEYHWKPLRLTFGEIFKVTDVACGYGFTIYAVNSKDKYKVYACGINSDSQVGYHDPRKGHPLGLLSSPARIELPFTAKTRVTGVAAGRAHTVVLTEEEGVYTLGNNAYGQCGRPVVEDEEYMGNRVVHHIPHHSVGEKITSVHCGQDHSLFMTEAGSVYSCGWGADGQLGLGHYDSSSRLSQVTGDILNERIIKVAGVGDCVLALSEKGEVFGWGNNEYQQLLDIEDAQQICKPVNLKKTRGLGKIVDIAAGGSLCAALNENGDVFVWGFGLLGLGPKVQKSPKPLQIPRTLFGENEFMKESKVVGLGGGLFHLAALTNLGQLYMWGRNKGACLGLGHTNDQFFPLKVSVGAHVLKVAGGVDHTIALCKPFT